MLSNVASQAFDQIGAISGFDGVDTKYTFSIYSIYAKPAGINCVYMFCTLQNGTYTPLYVGRASILSTRLSGHERLREAVQSGASHLLVHSPSGSDRIGYIEAEKRLIAHYSPKMNTHFMD